MEHHHIEVTKTARYFTLGPTGEGLGEIWYVCHGYRQLAGRFIRRFARLNDGSRRIIAPEGLSRAQRELLATVVSQVNDCHY